MAVRMVVALLFDVAETSAAESGVKGEDDYYDRIMKRVWCLVWPFFFLAKLHQLT